MVFIVVQRPPLEECKCHKPDSNKGKDFGPGTVWRCDNCGRAYEFIRNEVQSAQREGTWWTDHWKRATHHDGPDNRPVPNLPTVEPQHKEWR